VVDVLARAATIRPGDRVYTPKGPAEGYAVREVNRYDDDTIVIVYSTGRAFQARFGGEILRTADVLASLAPLEADERIRCRRDAGAHRAEHQRTST
jgi:hypothetical protein